MAGPSTSMSQSQSRSPANRKVWDSLCSAIGWGNFDKTTKLLPSLSEGDINAVDSLRGHTRYIFWTADDSRGNTLLHYAAYWCKADARIVRALLAAGAEPTVLNSAGERPAELAAPAALPALDSAWSAVSRVRPAPPPLLAAEGQPHEWPRRPFNELPAVALKLLKALLRCDIESTQRLLQSQTTVDGLNFGDRDNILFRLMPRTAAAPLDSRKAATTGNTPLHVSAFMATSADCPAVTCFRALLAAGADPMALNAQGFLPFALASSADARSVLLKSTVLALRDRGVASDDISAQLRERARLVSAGSHGDDSVLGLLAAIGGGLASAASRVS
jgi:hypothetical protein